ncbi:MAG: UPF0182 family protein [Chloroflexi bacterium]|nr:UPF0182 family protein [Chloroflexota bacterium]
MSFHVGDAGGPTFPGYPGTLVFPPNFGRVVRWALAALGVIVFFVLLSTARGLYTDWLWFDNVGYLSVFTKVLWTRVWLFLVAAVVGGALMGINAYVAYRNSRGESKLPIPPETVQWLNRLVLVAIAAGAVLITILLASAAASRWEVVLRSMNATPFGGAPDPVFDRDVAFYVFRLPLLEFVQGWFMGVFVVLIIAVLVIHFVYSSLRGIPFVITPRVRGHLAVLGALILFALAADHFLDRYKLLFSTQGAVFGASYTDANARLIALWVLTFIAIASGFMVLAGLLPALQGPPGLRLTLAAIGLWVAASILVGNVYPSLVQRLTVQPNELNQEARYIERNIKATRGAFALDRIETRDFPVSDELPAEVLYRNPETVNNVRLWDPRPLQDVYHQIQAFWRYYGFPDVDVDRYQVGGQYRQVLVGARELQPENLPPEAQRWVNQKLQYTHGYGAAMSPVTEFTTEGKPVFFLKDIPPAGELPLQRPEIYFGERSPTFVIVNARSDEISYVDAQGNTSRSRYGGQGGVLLKSFLRRAAYAWQFGDINILISDQLTPESRIQYRRTIQERIQRVAPFLILDRDPYLVVENGELRWIQDAYTVTNRYPYSTPYRRAFNYIRNSVKVVLDPYQGTLTFYVAEPGDPLVQTYQSIFPTLFRPLEEMSPFLQDHLRYPEDLFSVQAEMYLQYHMEDVNQFFQKGDQWDIPQEEFSGSLQSVVPYYVIMKLPGETKPEFVLILPFTPWRTADKPNMVGWLAARMDKPNYGKLLTFSFPRGVQIDGPNQVEARISQDLVIKTKFALLCTGDAVCLRGNLLVIPIEQSILYVEPLYLRSKNVLYPELKQVILASSKKVVMEATLEKAVAALAGAPTAPAVAPARPPPQQPGTPAAALQELDRVRTALKNLKEELSGLEEALKRLEDLLEQEQR